MVDGDEMRDELEYNPISGNKENCGWHGHLNVWYHSSAKHVVEINLKNGVPCTDISQGSTSLVRLLPAIPRPHEKSSYVIRLSDNQRILFKALYQR